MELGETLYVTDRESWRAWLAENYRTKSEIWLVYYRKETGKPRVSYEEAVEEALCYGWIDSTAKSIDSERFAQRFSPRRKTSGLSQPNRERVRSLIKEGRMTQAGLDAIAHVFDPDDEEGPLIVAPDVLEALRQDEQAWEHFQKLPEDYKRVRIAYIESQRRHGEEQFRRALDNFIKKTAQNKRIGLMR